MARDVFLVSILLLLNICLTIPLSLGLLSDENRIPSFGVVKSGSVDGSVDVFTSFSEDWPNSEARARELARKFDVIITWNRYFIAAMKDANPNVIILRYIPTCVIYSDQAEWNQAVAENWLLKDSAGNYIYLKKWPTAHICNPANPNYLNWFANTYCAGKIAEGYDGLFGDGNSAITGYGVGEVSGQPINPATGNPYTAQEWVDALLILNRNIKNAIGTKLLIGNGLMNSRHYYAYPEAPENYQRLLDTLDGAMIEYAVMSPWEGWRSEQTWLNDIEVIKWHTSQGKMCMLWSQKAGAEEFIYASFLLGIGDFSRTNVRIAENAEDPYVQDLLNIEIGSPVGDYYRIEGTHVYARDFTKVKVLVNPTDTPYTIQVAGVPRTIDPHTGVFLS